MFMDIFKRLEFSDNPATLEWKIQEALDNGEDLCADPFVFGEFFCQWVTRRESMYEYKLVSAFNPASFFETVQRMTKDGWELAFKQVEWHGMICQWMVKLRMADGLEVEDAAAYAGAVLPTEVVSTAMPGFNLVAGVQVLRSFAAVS